MYLEGHLKPTWDWLLTVMDATEAQLRFGVSLTRSADPTHPEHPLNNASSLPGGNFSGLLNTAALSLTLQSNTGRNQRSGIATSSNISTPQASTRLTVGFAGVGEPSRNSREREGIIYYLYHSNEIFPLRNAQMCCNYIFGNRIVANKYYF